MEDRVKVRNITDKVWLDRYDGRDYAIPPGETDTIPRAAFHLWFGHPGAKDPDREKREAQDRRGDFVFSPWPCLEIIEEQALTYEEMVEKYEKSLADDEPDEPEEPEFPDLDKVLPPKKKPAKK